MSTAQALRVSEPYSVEVMQRRRDGSDVVARVLVLGPRDGFDALITYDGAVSSARVTEVWDANSGLYVVADADAARDEQVRRVCDCNDDLLDELEAFAREYDEWVAAEEALDRDACCASGCGACTGERGYAF